MTILYNKDINSVPVKIASVSRFTLYTPLCYYACRRRAEEQEGRRSERMKKEEGEAGEGRREEAWGSRKQEDSTE